MRKYGYMIEERTCLEKREKREREISYMGTSVPTLLHQPCCFPLPDSDDVHDRAGGRLYVDEVPLQLSDHAHRC